MAKRFLHLSLTAALLSLSALFVVRVALSTNAPLATVPVTASNFAFVPKTVTIEVGDIVQWDNNDVGIFHIVVADNSSFTSGDPDASAWTFSAPFDTPGTFRYYCVVHGLPGGLGMSGVINVTPVLDEFLFLPTVLKN